MRLWCDVNRFRVKRKSKLKIINKLIEGKKENETKTQTIDARQQSPTLWLCVRCRTIECTNHNWRTPHFSIYCFTYRTLPFSVFKFVRIALASMLGIIIIQSSMNRKILFRKCIYSPQSPSLVRSNVKNKPAHSPEGVLVSNFKWTACIRCCSSSPLAHTSHRTHSTFID